MVQGNGGKKNLLRVRQIEGVCEKSTRALCEWDSGLVIVLVMETPMRTQAGIQCPGFMWKNYLPHRRKMQSLV